MTDFTQSPRALDLEARVRRFIDEVVIPYESDPRCQGPLADEVVQELRRHARAAGLLAPQVGAEWGGHGLDHRDTAVVLRASGYSLLGPVAMNCMAPDEGNMHMLERIATPAQKERFLRPLAAGTLRSSFLMTEPDGGAGSDPGMMLTCAVERDDHWVIDGRKWFITGAEGAGVAIVMARTAERRDSGRNPGTLLLVHEESTATWPPEAATSGARRVAPRISAPTRPSPEPSAARSIHV